jgi:hypothetical protein
VRPPSPRQIHLEHDVAQHAEELDTAPRCGQAATTASTICAPTQAIAAGRSGESGAGERDREPFARRPHELERMARVLKGLRQRAQHRETARAAGRGF